MNNGNGWVLKWVSGILATIMITVLVTIVSNVIANDNKATLARERIKEKHEYDIQSLKEIVVRIDTRQEILIETIKNIEKKLSTCY